MHKLILPLAAAAALALPASAFAHGGHHSRHHHGRHDGGFTTLAFHANVKAHSPGNPPATAGATKLSGVGTSFGVASASIDGSTFTATLATTWSSATSKTFNGGSVSCAPSTASVTLSGTTTSYTGKTCSWTRNGTTLYGFAGSSSSGMHAFLKEDGTAVTGAVFSGNKGLHLGALASLGSGNCDHH